MASSMFDTVNSADWYVKGLGTGAILLLSLLAHEWINRLWLSWRLRKYPIINHGKPQAEFTKGAASIMRKGLDTVSAHTLQSLYLGTYPFGALDPVANHEFERAVQRPTVPR